jgi:hypothetical protein
VSVCMRICLSLALCKSGGRTETKQIDKGHDPFQLLLALVCAPPLLLGRARYRGAQGDARCDVRSSMTVSMGFLRKRTALTRVISPAFAVGVSAVAALAAAPALACPSGCKAVSATPPRLAPGPTDGRRATHHGPPTDPAAEHTTHRPRRSSRPRCCRRRNHCSAHQH